MKRYKLQNILFFLGFLASSQVVARESDNLAKPSVIPTVEKGITNKFYEALGVHDGSKIFGLFLPQVAKGNTWTWWLDTGSIYGIGSGFRQVSRNNWFAQDWFWGAYCYFESPNWGDFFVPQWKRLNLGLELAGSKFGKITLNHYRNIFFDAGLSYKNATLEDIQGISLRFSSDYFRKLNPFIALSMHSILDNRLLGLYDSITPLKDLAVGLRYQLTQSTDFEIKLNFLDPYQSPVHVGLRRYSTQDNAAGYFNNHFYRAPDRSIAHYNNAWVRELFGSGPSDANRGYGENRRYQEDWEDSEKQLFTPPTTNQDQQATYQTSPVPTPKEGSASGSRTNSFGSSEQSISVPRTEEHSRENSKDVTPLASTPAESPPLTSQDEHNNLALIPEGPLTTSTPSPGLHLGFRKKPEKKQELKQRPGEALLRTASTASVE